MVKGNQMKAKLSAESLADLLISNDRRFLITVYLPTFDEETRALFFRLLQLDEEALNSLITHEEFTYGTYEDLQANELEEEVS